MTAVLKQPSPDDLLAERDRTLGRHAQELADIERQIAQAMRARGLSYSLPSPVRARQRRAFMRRTGRSVFGRVGFVRTAQRIWSA
jgi:hypothetical protein